MRDWTSAVLAAVKRQAYKREDLVFTRKAMVDEELATIVQKVGSVGATPEQTLSRELQELADIGVISFVNNRGVYRLENVTPFDQRNADYRPVMRYDIDGFRSLRSFHISLNAGLNALVGPNGAGKTNFIEFLDFISTLIMRDASAAVSISGGVSRVFSQENSKKLSPKITARICGNADISSAYDDPKERTFFRFEYFVEVRFSKTHSAIYISSEKIKFFALHSRDEEIAAGRSIGTIHLRRRTPSSEVDPIITVSPKLLTIGLRNPLRYLRRGIAGSAPRLQRPDSEFVITNAPGPDESLLTVRPIRPAMEAIRLAVSRGRAFNLNPTKAKQPDELSRPPVIGADGAGLSATIYHMQQVKRNAPTQYSYRFKRYGTSTLDTVIEWTKLVLPELQDIVVTADPHSGKYIIFLIVGEGERTLRIPLQSASDGTIKWLAFVAMILARGSSYSLEEPENYLHPKMQQFLVELVRECIDEDQKDDFFILSTHSETVINQLKPEELIIFEFRKGSTFCRRLQNPISVSEEINRTGFGLGYFYSSNAVS